jgi:hypothetical protein
MLKCANILHDWGGAHAVFRSVFMPYAAPSSSLFMLGMLDNFIVNAIPVTPLISCNLFNHIFPHSPYALSIDNGDGWIEREALEMHWQKVSVASSTRHPRRIIQ